MSDKSTGTPECDIDSTGTPECDIDSTGTPECDIDSTGTLEWYVRIFKYARKNSSKLQRLGSSLSRDFPCLFTHKNLESNE